MTQPDTRPTADDFTAMTTRAGRKVHFTEARWPRRTLCGNSAYPLDDPNEADYWATCKQCEKSRNRRMEGRRS